MTREEQIRRAAEAYDTNNERYQYIFTEGAEWADSHRWHKVTEELPPVDTEVVCKMKGVPHTEHFICKWDGKYWWHWGYFGQDAQGWFGLNEGWEVEEWKEIKED